jgi:hypothetical protein
VSRVRAKELVIQVAEHDADYIRTELSPQHNDPAGEQCGRKDGERG